MANFTLGEMVKSSTAERLGIPNNPPAQARVNITETIRLLECIRAEWAEYCERRSLGTPAIRITSGYRCETLNRAVGGVANSQHLLGEAADIFVPNEETALKYLDFLRTHTPFDQLILEPRDARIPRWLHVSYTIRRPVRGQVL